MVLCFTYKLKIRIPKSEVNQQSYISPCANPPGLKFAYLILRFTLDLEFRASNLADILLVQIYVK